MSEVLYPWGYGKTLVNEVRLWQLARIDDLCDPETARRVKAWIRSRKGQIGIGGAVRFVQPNKPGFAPAGKSFHELQEWFDGLKNYAAFDLVVRNGNNIHRSPRWDEVPRQGSGHPDITNYGVHCNVSGEPWHMQAIEIDGWATWAANGRKRPNANFKIKGEPVLPPMPTTPPPVGQHPGTIAPGTRTLKLTSPQMYGIDVAYLQQTLERQGLRIKGGADGYYGPATVEAVKTMQGWNKMTKNGVVGPAVWKAVIAYNQPKQPVKPSSPSAPDQHTVGSRVLKLTSPTMKGSDVRWVQNVLRGQGLSVSVDSVYGRQTRDRVKTLQGWNNLKQDGIVGPKTWEVLKRY